MPLTPVQQEVLAALAAAPRDDRYLAGGAALHFAPDSARFSEDLDFFHDAEARVAAAFTADRATLQGAGFDVTLDLVLPGFVRATVRRGDDATRVDWAHESAWRFLPLIRDPLGGWLLAPVDLALSKLLALAGRDEPRDFVDILWVHERILPLAGLVWAAVGKDPGLSPGSLLDLLRRRGHDRPEAFARLALVAPFDLPAARATWRQALEDADRFSRERPAAEMGCLYRDLATGRFVLPDADRSLEAQGVVVHRGAPGGVVPRVGEDAS